MIALFKEYLYIIRQISIGKSILYILLYPLGFLESAQKKLHILHEEKRWHKKIYGMEKAAGITHRNTIDASMAKDIDRYFLQYGLKVNNKWHKTYSHINGISSVKYIPENLFYLEIEPVLNNKKMLPVFKDKNTYQYLFPHMCHPETIFRSINGRVYDSEYSEISLQDSQHFLSNLTGKFIIKPSASSGGGKGIKILQIDKGFLSIDQERIKLTDLIAKYEGNFIVQKKIEQHPSLSKVHPPSVNTIRIISLRLHESIHILSAAIKFGTNGAHVDNISAGGLTFGIKNNGTLKDFGLKNDFKKYQKHPDTGVDLINFSIPGLPQVKTTVKQLHKMNFYFDLISWDIAIDKNEQPVLIESNLLKQSLNIHQLLNGPLFGDLTDEVLKKVFMDKRQSD